MKFEREQLAPQLHRSLGFWLGLLPVVFLLWVWVDSREQTSIWTRAMGSHAQLRDSVAISKAEILFEHKKIAAKRSARGLAYFLDTPPWGKFQHYVRGRLPDEGDSPWFPAPRKLQVIHSMRGPGGKDVAWFMTEGFAIPLWMVLVIYLVLWIGLLVWWRRRKRRLAVERRNSIDDQ